MLARQNKNTPAQVRHCSAAGHAPGRGCYSLQQIKP